MTVSGLPPLATLPPRAAAAPTTNATLAASVPLGPMLRRLEVRPDAPALPFRAGQYVSIGLVAGRTLLQRPYSIASPPGEPERLEFLVRLVPGGELTPRLWRLQPGARVRLGRPKGLFGLDPADDRAHLLVATGTGLAPMLAMLHELSGRAAPPDTILVHGASFVDELVARERLVDHAARAAWFTYHPAISRPGAPANRRWLGEAGRVDAVLQRVWHRHRLRAESTVAYLCGSPGMIAAAASAFDVLGLPGASLRREEYWSPTPPRSR
jgi:ferredoxin-NADP reductase